MPEVNQTAAGDDLVSWREEGPDSTEQGDG